MEYFGFLWYNLIDYIEWKSVQMKNKKKIIRNLVFFILLIIITFRIILKDADFGLILEAMGKVKIQYILIAIFFMFLYIMGEAINIRRTLKALNEKQTFVQDIKYAFIGFFFSSITPAASGGQPMQIYYMHRDGISVANSTLTLLINLSCIQIVTLSTAFISLAFNYQHLNDALLGFFILGVTLNSSALALLLISIISKKMSEGIINIAIKFLKFFRIKNIEDKKRKFEETLNQYQESAVYIKKNKKLMLKALLTTYFQFFIYYSIPYWIYCSFGLGGYNIIQIIMVQSLLFATVSGIPSPGAVGVSEGGFLAIYKKIVPERIIDTAMILTRSVNFYLFVLISAIVVMISMFKDKREIKLEENNELNNIEQ